VRITSRPFRCSYCGRESTTALIELCTGRLPAATELVRGVLAEEHLSIDVDRLLDVDQHNDAEVCLKPELLTDG